MPTILSLSGENRASVLMQLNRWSAAGKLIQLRRGAYTLAPAYRNNDLSVPLMANVIYQPSYLSMEWALGYYGLIPEKVTAYTCVTTRATRRFENGLGVFYYHHVTLNLFNGISNVKIGDRDCLLASPEKAVLDLMYFKKKAWGRERLEELRLQNTGLIDRSKLAQQADAYPVRVRKGAVLIRELLESEEGGQEI